MRNIPTEQTHDFQREGDLLGPYMAVDPNRPNLRGRATPQREEPSDRPIYRTYKVCRSCHANYVGASWVPQYDNDEPQGGYCERCITRIEVAQREKFLREDRETYAGMRAKARRGGRKQKDQGEAARPTSVWND
jgi:hypothetical protein